MTDIKWAPTRLAGQVPLQLLATCDDDPCWKHRWEPRDRLGSGLDWAGHHARASGVSGGARMLDERDRHNSRGLQRHQGLHFVLDSAIIGTAHVFENTDDLRAEIVDARAYGGMHYRNSVEVGATIGEQVADWVAYFFRPRRGK